MVLTNVTAYEVLWGKTICILAEIDHTRNFKKNTRKELKQKEKKTK